MTSGDAAYAGPPPSAPVAPAAVSWTASDRRALAAVALQFGVNGALFASFVPRLPEIRDQIDVGTGALGVLLSVGSATGLVGSATVTRLVGGIGTRLTIVIGTSAMAGFLALVGVATVWPLVLVGLAGMSMFDVYVDVAMNMQGSWLSARRRRPVMNRLHGLWSLGAALGGLAASWVAEAGVGLRTHLVVAAAVLLVLGVVLATSLLRNDAPATPTAEPVVEQGQASADRSPASTRAMTRTEFLAAGFLAVVIETGAIGWAAFRLGDDFGESAGVAAFAYVAMTAGMTVGRFAGDSVAHRIGGGALLRASTVLAGAGLAAATLVPSVPVAVVGFAATGLGAATMLPKLYDDAAKMPGPPGAGLGALTAGIRSSILVVPVLVGAIAAVWSVGGALAVVCLPAAAGFLWVTRVTR
jgi:fucose permease